MATLPRQSSLRRIVPRRVAFSTHVITRNNIIDLESKSNKMGIQILGKKKIKKFKVERLTHGMTFCWNQGTILPIDNAGYM